MVAVICQKLHLSSAGDKSSYLCIIKFSTFYSSLLQSNDFLTKNPVIFWHQTRMWRKKLSQYYLIVSRKSHSCTSTNKESTTKMGHCMLYLPKPHMCKFSNKFGESEHIYVFICKNSNKIKKFYVSGQHCVAYLILFNVIMIFFMIFYSL